MGVDSGDGVRVGGGVLVRGAEGRVGDGIGDGEKIGLGRGRAGKDGFYDIPICFLKLKTIFSKIKNQSFLMP